MRSLRTIGTIAMLAVAAPAAAQQAARTPTAAPPPAEWKGQAAPQGFSVVLVLGDLNGGSTADGSVPPAARKALNDMKDFLPFKGYKLLDAEWILGSRRATTRLRGPDNQDYELTLTSNAAPGTRVRVSFQLRDGIGEPPSENMAMSSARAGARAATEQRIRELERAIEQARERNADSTVYAKEIAELKSRLDSGNAMVYTLAGFGHRSVIDTSFDMEIGETVVVGTSRLKEGKEGGKALIALLTAVPKAGTTTKQE